MVCRYEQTTLPPEPSAAGRARAWVADRLGAWDVAGDVDDLRLVVSELVSNAVLYAKTTIDVVLSIGEGVVELTVCDRSPGTARPQAKPADDGATGGRGLVLVQALSDDWGVTERMDGKHVWFRTALPPGWRYTDRCVCARRSASGTRTLGSGRSVVVIDPGALPGTG